MDKRKWANQDDRYAKMSARRNDLTLEEASNKGKIIKKGMCHSLKCTKDPFGIYGIRKFTKKDYCPDCGDCLRWVTVRT